LNQSGSKVAPDLILDYFFQKRKKLAFSLILSEGASYLPQHCLYFLPLPHGVKSAIFLQFLQKFCRNYKEFVFSTTKI